MPAARVSATDVDVKRNERGTVALTESTVSQIGKVVLSTVKKGAPAEEVIAISERPGVPEPFTYVSEAELGVATSVVPGKIRSVTLITLAGVGEGDVKVIVVVLMVFTRKPPQLAPGATTIDLGVVASAVCDVVGVTVAVAAAALAEVKAIENGVEMATVCDGPAV